MCLRRLGGNTHLGSGGGIHYFVADPPPYRDDALRGPTHLPVVFDHLTD